MQVKLLEIRDVGTFIGVLCVDMNPVDQVTVKFGPAAEEDPPIFSQHDRQRYLLRRVGYPCDGRPNIAITEVSASGKPCWNDPYGWGGRTMPVAHKYIIENWKSLQDGDVVDVSFILGESNAPKVSERITARLP